MITLTSQAGDAFTFDVLEIEYRTQNLVTSHPVENATDVTDHIQRQLDEWYVRAIVTNTPMSAVAVDAGAKSRVEAARDFLEAGHADTFTMAIAGERDRLVALVSWPWRRDQYGRAVFTLGLREVRIARAQRVAIPPRAAPSTAAAPSTQALGQQSANPLGQSILLNLTGN